MGQATSRSTDTLLHSSRNACRRNDVLARWRSSGALLDKDLGGHLENGICSWLVPGTSNPQSAHRSVDPVTINAVLIGFSNRPDQDVRLTRSANRQRDVDRPSWVEAGRVHLAARAITHLSTASATSLRDCRRKNVRRLCNDLRFHNGKAAWEILNKTGDNCATTLREGCSMPTRDDLDSLDASSLVELRLDPSPVARLNVAHPMPMCHADSSGRRFVNGQCLPIQANHHFARSPSLAGDSKPETAYPVAVPLCPANIATIGRSRRKPARPHGILKTTQRTGILTQFVAALAHGVTAALEAVVAIRIDGFHRNKRRGAI